MPEKNFSISLNLLIKIVKKYIAPNEIGEKGAVLIGEDDWNTIQETLFLSEKRITNQIKHRKNEEILDFESTWDNL
ncbi:hypothetical protein [Macrococcoides bohemicum]|uniref:hypothetical protein n=1 Tax=Macrococcoides bohemicum TaxID=1903056 RepID=UPI00193ED3E4|nr:hypothetical protein [Macrococcus bohemicus]QRN49850.1 type II toxin-antitoxin system Phd/YefM family antitoxin [Macrococcus bohemicus]